MAEPSGGRRDGAIAAIAGLVAALVVLAAGAVLLRVAERESLPSLAVATEASVEAIGRSVADLIETGLGYDIPLDSLYGVENHFDGIVAAMPTVDALALERADGSVLVATGLGVDGKRFPVHRDGAVVATVVLTPAPPLIGPATARLRLALVAAAATAGAIAGGIAWLVLARQIDRGRRRLEAAVRASAEGRFPPPPSMAGRGVLAEAALAYDQCLEPLRAALRRLEDAVATVRAIDFDGSLARRLEPMLETVAPLRRAGARSDDRMSGAPDDGGEAPVSLGTAWIALGAVSIAGMTVPFVANFAVDRQWGLAGPSWWPSVPWIAAGLAAALGAVAGRRCPPARARVLAAGGLVAMAATLAAVTWTRDYAPFLALMAGAGGGLGLALGALGPGRGRDDGAGVPVAVWAIAVLAVGPMLGGLLGEAVGRRLGFMAAGGLALGLAAATLAVRPPSRRQAGGGAGAVRLRLAEAGAVAGAVLLVGMAAGAGYENYLGTGLAAAALGLGAAVGARPAWPPAAALAVVLTGLGAWVWTDGGIAATAGALALVGIGLGGRLRAVEAEAAPAIWSTGLGVATGAAAAGLAVEGGGPPATGAAVVLCGLALAEVPRLARRRRQPA